MVFIDRPASRRDDQAAKYPVIIELFTILVKEAGIPYWLDLERYFVLLLTAQPFRRLCAFIRRSAFSAGLFVAGAWMKPSGRP